MQVYKAAAPFMRLMWSGAVAGVETQPSVCERRACMLAALLSLKLDAVRSKKHFQVSVDFVLLSPMQFSQLYNVLFVRTPCTTPPLLCLSSQCGCFLVPSWFCLQGHLLYFTFSVVQAKHLSTEVL